VSEPCELTTRYQSLGWGAFYTHARAVSAIPKIETAIIAVASHPMASSGPEIVKFPITWRWAAMRIMASMTGTATTPLITALQ
jgi:hypothetical protein